LAHCHEQPEPYTLKPNLTEKRVEVYTVGPSAQDRIYVSKGTPMAKPEMGEVIRTYTYRNGDQSSWKEIRPTGRYFLEGPVTTKTRKYTAYLGRNPEYDDQAFYRFWDQKWAFKHRRKNYTGARCSNGHRREKHGKVKAIRLEGHSIVHEAKLDFQHMQHGHNTELCEYLWCNEPEEQEEDYECFYDDDWLREPWGYESWDDPDYEDPYDPYEFSDNIEEPWDYDWEYEPRLIDHDGLFYELDQRNSVSGHSWR
jgi:hypothetical protein